MKATIQKKKIIYNQGRIICNDKKMSLENLIKIVEHYLWLIKQFDKVPGLEVTQEKFNFGIRFNMFGLKITVGKLFEIYNEIAEIEGLTVYSKLWYNSAKAFEICPSDVY